MIGDCFVFDSLFINPSAMHAIFVPFQAMSNIQHIINTVVFETVHNFHGKNRELT